jgi:hypothetical protein
MQCCQLLAKNFGQFNLKLRPLAKKFGRTQYLFLGAVLQALLPQISSKYSGVNPWVYQSISSNNQGLYVKCTHQKSLATFLPYFEKVVKNSATVSSGL